MASTTIFSVKNAIVATLGEAEGLSGVTISADKEPERVSEYIWVPEGKAERSVELIRRPPYPLDEIVRVTVWIVVIKGSSSPTPSEKRAYELLEAAETAIRELPNGLGDAQFGHWIESVEPKPALFDGKWGHQIKAVVLAKARI